MPNKTNAVRTVESATSALYANIRFASAGRQIKTLVVTSANQGDGKTYIAAKLAQTIAASGKKTLLVDADFVDADLTIRYGNKNASFAAVIHGDQDLVASVIDTDLPNLQLLGCEQGVATSADLLGCAAAEKVCARMADAYDYVIFDTPALDAHVDAAIIASRADATVLVARAHQTKRDTLVAAVEQLKKADAHLIGTVLNDVESD